MATLGTPLATGRTAEIFLWENDCILKLIRVGFPGSLADQEWEKSEAAWRLGAPAPRPVARVEVEGRQGVVFQRLHGPNLVQALQRSPWRLDQFARILGTLQAELHRIEAPQFPPMHELVIWSLRQPSLLSERQQAAVRALLARLADGNTLCHADFHPENILLTERGPMVIDWEGSQRGDPAGDAAFTILWIRMAFLSEQGRNAWLKRKIGQRFEAVYWATYTKQHGPIAHVAEWLAIQAACRMNEENRSSVKLLESLVRPVIPDW